MTFSIPDCFMIAFISGALFGLVYEIFRIVRLVFRFRPVIFICDVLFFMLAAIAVLKLSEYLGNYVRIYTVLGFGAGVFTYIVTIGRLLNLLESAASVVWRKTLGRLFHAICNSMHKLFGIIAQKAKGVFVKISKDFNNKRKNHHEPLQSQGKKVYNSNDINKIGGSENRNVIKATIRRS